MERQLSNDARLMSPEEISQRTQQAYRSQEVSPRSIYKQNLMVQAGLANLNRSPSSEGVPGFSSKASSSSLSSMEGDIKTSTQENTPQFDAYTALSSQYAFPPTTIDNNPFTPPNNALFYEDSPDSQETATDDAPYAVYDPLQVKHRRRTTAPQLKVLESQFAANPKPDIPVRKQLADQLNMTPREVQVWFQNRRAKVKRLDKRVSSANNLTTRRSSTSSAPMSVMEAQAAGIREATNTWLNAGKSQSSPSQSPEDAVNAFVPVDARSSAPSAIPAGVPWPSADYVSRRGSLPGETLPYYTPTRPRYQTQPTVQPGRPTVNTNSINEEQTETLTNYETDNTKMAAQQYYPASLLQRRKDSGNTLPSAHQTDFANFVALSRYQASLGGSEASSSSYNSFSFDSAPATESTVTTPTSIMSNMSSYNDAFGYALDRNLSTFPAGFDPDTRRSSCPAEFVNSFSQMGFPNMYNQPVVQPPIPQPHWPTSVPLNDQQTFAAPYPTSYGLPANYRRASVATGYAPANDTAQRPFTSFPPMHYHMQPTADSSRRMSTSLEPIAEAPSTMHQPQANPPAPYFMLNGAADDTFESVPSISRPGLSRKARSSASIQSTLKDGLSPDRFTNQSNI